MTYTKEQAALNSGLSLVPAVELEKEIKLLAIATREQHSSLMREAVKIRGQSENRLEAVNHYLRKFCDRDLLTGKELAVLSKICEITIGAKSITENEFAQTLHLYYDLIDSGSNPLAIAVAGVAVSSLELAIELGPKVAASIGSDDVAGGIAGAGVGVQVPNPWGPVGGVVGGALLGGAGASFLSWWEGS